VCSLSLKVCLFYFYFNAPGEGTFGWNPGCQVGSSSGSTGDYGRGFYFSADFNVGVDYARRNQDVPDRCYYGSRALLLCKVLVGKDKLIIPSATLTPLTKHFCFHHLRRVNMHIAFLCVGVAIDLIAGHEPRYGRREAKRVPA
jgi:hypothetical protein